MAAVSLQLYRHPEGYLIELSTGAQTTTSLLSFEDAGRMAKQSGSVSIAYNPPSSDPATLLPKRCLEALRSDLEKRRASNPLFPTNPSREPIPLCPEPVLLEIDLPF